jgi:hypothetical protein
MVCITSQHQHMQQNGLVQAFLKAANQVHKQAHVSTSTHGVHLVAAPAHAAE